MASPVPITVSPGFQSCSLLKDLYGGHAFFQTDDFAYQIFFTYIDHLGDLESGVALSVDNRTVDAVNNTCFTHVQSSVKFEFFVCCLITFLKELSKDVLFQG